MKKTTKNNVIKKLQVNRTVLRALTDEQLADVNGGMYRSGPYCSTWLNAKCSNMP